MQALYARLNRTDWTALAIRAVVFVVKVVIEDFWFLMALVSLVMGYLGVMLFFFVAAFYFKLDDIKERIDRLMNDLDSPVVDIVVNREIKPIESGNKVAPAKVGDGEEHF